MEALVIGVWMGLLIVAALTDIARLEIPNTIPLLLAAGFAPLAFAADLSPGMIGLHYLIGVGALALGIPLFVTGVFGGGDVKLLAAAAVWTGFAALPDLLLGMAIGGGLLAASLMATRCCVAAHAGRPAFLNRLLAPGGPAPYAVAIAIGGALAAANLPLL